MSADAQGRPVSGASAHLIASSWTSANTFRRSLVLNLTRMPAGVGIGARALLKIPLTPG
jgi:hypothetical protein